MVLRHTTSKRREKMEKILKAEDEVGQCGICVVQKECALLKDEQVHQLQSEIENKIKKYDDDDFCWVCLTKVRDIEPVEVLLQNGSISKDVLFKNYRSYGHPYFIDKSWECRFCCQLTDEEAQLKREKAKNQKAKANQNP